MYVRILPVLYSKSDLSFLYDSQQYYWGIHKKKKAKRQRSYEILFLNLIKIENILLLFGVCRILEKKRDWESFDYFDGRKSGFGPTYKICDVMLNIIGKIKFRPIRVI